MFKSYQFDAAGKKMDRKARKFSRRATFDYNKGVNKLLKEARKVARLALEEGK
jgi:hypothetical protein